MTQRIFSLNDLVAALSELSVDATFPVDIKHEETVEKAHALATFLIQLKAGGAQRGLDSEFLAVFFSGIDHLVEQEPFGDVINRVFDDTVGKAFEKNPEPAECHTNCDDPMCPYTHS